MVQQRTNMVIINEKGKPISSIRFSFMIPVPSGVVTVKSIKNKPSPEYRRLLDLELRFCRKNEKAIRRMAKHIHNNTERCIPMENNIQVEYRISPDSDTLAKSAAAYFLGSIKKYVADKGYARIAISGGNTPKKTLESLSDYEGEFFGLMPWNQIQLFFVDERMVPPDDLDSNYKMVREAMLDKTPLKPSQIYRIYGELEPNEAALQYESAIRDCFSLKNKVRPIFDMIQLGMGDDGHTASLFPNTDALYQQARIAVANYVPQKDTWRVTLTHPVINAATDVFFLISGKDKAEPLRRVLCGDYEPENLPAQLIQPQSGKLLLLLDKDAAAQLPAPDVNGVGRLTVPFSTITAN